MQFVQIKPCNLYQTAQEQLKKAEEVKKLKEVKKEEPEEWQNVSPYHICIQISGIQPLDKWAVNRSTDDFLGL